MNLSSPRPRRARRAALALACAAVLTAGATACGGGQDDTGGDAPAATVEGAQKPGGITLDTPFEKPDLTLTDTSGKPYDFAEETKGRPTLLYFGYTHCPDICPLTMSNISIAASKLSEAEREKLEVVFVTTDPERDTPEELGKWLRAQSPDFTGLTGDFKDIQAAAKQLGVTIEPSYTKKNGDVVSTHGTQVLAFSPKDDKAHVLYTERSSTSDVLTRELPALLKGETP